MFRNHHIIIAMRRTFFLGLIFATAAVAAQPPPPPAAAAFDLDELSIAGLQQRMATGDDTARSLAEKYLARIEAIDRNGPALHSVIEVNPDALDIADRLDAERKSGHLRGPLHGVPVLLKDNIATADRLMTTAGSIALAGARPPRDAFIVERLREAGVVILGKTNLSEWANFRSTHSTSGWSGRGGDRHRNGRLHRVAVDEQRARRDQADARPREPHRYRADRAQPGHGRTDGAHGR